MSDIKLGIVFDVQNGKFKSEVKESAQVFSSLGNASQKTSTQVNQFNKVVDDTNTTLFKTNKVATGVKNAIVGMTAGFGAVQLGKGLTQELAAFQDIRTRLQGLSADAADYADKERWLISLAQEHHKELNGLADGYSRLSTLSKEKIITDQQARDMLEGLSDAASRNGASNADLERVYYGLSQALGAGTVNMEDFKQVTEPLPDLMAKIAKAAGQETSSGLKTLIGTGTYTSEVFGKHLVEALQGYAGASAETAENINAKYRDIKREYQLLAVELEQPINGALLPTLDGLAEGLSFLKEHTEGVITVLQGGLVIAAGHAVNAITAKTVATAESILSDQAKAQASLAAAKSDDVLAISANKRAIQEQAAAKRALANANTTYARTNAVKNLAIANGQVAASEKALAITTNNLTVATNKLSVARKGLSVMSGLVGGLPGLLTLAGFAMYSFATSTGEAADEAKRLNDENAKLNPFANYTFETATGALQRYKGQLELAQQMAEETQTRFENPFFKNVTAGDVVAANKEVENLTQTIVALQTIVDGKNPNKTTGNKPVNQDNKALDAFKNQEDALKRQLALLGQTTELAKAEYETSLGKYKDLLPGQKQTILNFAKEIDAKNNLIATDKQALQKAEQLEQTSKSYAENLQKKIELTGQSTNVAQLNYEIEHGSLKGINDELRDHLTLLAEKADATTALGEQQLPFWEQMQEHIGSTSEQFDTMWGNSFDRFAQGIGDATASSIIEGQNFGDAMKTIGRSVISEVISGLVQIGVKKLALSAIEKGINKTAATAASGTMIAQAQAMALMGGLNAYSSTAAIPITGAFAAPGAMAAALAITEPMAMSVGSFAAGMAGMAHDGIDEIPNEGTWLLDKGERVVDKRTNQDLKQALNNGDVGKNNGAVTVQLNITATDTGGFDTWYRSNRNMIISDVSDAVRSPA